MGRDKGRYGEGKRRVRKLFRQVRDGHIEEEVRESDGQSQTDTDRNGEGKRMKKLLKVRDRRGAEASNGRTDEEKDGISKRRTSLRRGRTEERTSGLTDKRESGRADERTLLLEERK